jgi:hypothetical protein
MNKINNIKEEIINLLKTVNRNGMNKLINRLEISDFFEAPASAKQHGNFVGGLAKHVLSTLNILKEKNQRYNLELSEETMIICALLHDNCKIDFYKLQEKWRKDSYNKWEKYTAYGYDDKFPIGHGEKSVILVQRFIELSDEEVALIRWHMGPFGLSDNQLKLYSAALKIYPSIVAMFTADFESTVYLEEVKKV